MTDASFTTFVIISKHSKHLKSLRIHLDPMGIFALSNNEGLSVSGR